MNNMLKTGLLTLGLGIALSPMDAGAVITNHTVYSNAVNHCQAFTPGITNTIRNRVIGSENIGAPMAVACNFTSSNNNNSASATYPTEVWVYFHNGAAGAANVTCTLLTGTVGVGSGSNYTVAKSIPIGASSSGFLIWTAEDNPTPDATTLGNLLVGVNCTLPTNMTMTGTVVRWQADNGI